MKDTQVSADTETITPEVASAILAQNGRNRSISANRIRQLVGAMERGEFNGQNGETIKLTKEGHLEDGQHRLISIVESGTTQKLLVARGVPEGSQETIDIGRARTFGDMLRIRGARTLSVLRAG